MKGLYSSTVLVKTKSTASSKTVRLHQLNGNDAWQVTGNGAEEVQPWLEQITGLVRTGGSASLVTVYSTFDTVTASRFEAYGVLVYMWLPERPEIAKSSVGTRDAMMSRPSLPGRGQGDLGSIG
jgi:hypothetical protein